MPVLGTDGVAPYYNPDNPWTIWELSQVFNGGPGQGMYVPRVNDYVVDAPSGTLYIVTALNTTTYLSTLQQIEIAKLPPILKYSNEAININIPDSVSPYRLYFNSQTNPYTLNIDASLVVYNTMANTCQLFLGTDILNANPLAVFINNDGIVNNTNIPLIPVNYNNSSNTYVKEFPTFYTNQLLQNGDLVTLLIYNAAGQVCSKQVLVVEDCSAYPTQSQGLNLVTGLSLESPFVSVTEPNTIKLPVNIGVSDLYFTGIVHYNNGSLRGYSVNNGSPFNVYGLDQVLKSNILGTVPITLQYSLQPGENAIENVSYNGTTVTIDYNLVLDEPNYDYQMQLYPIPFYNGSEYIIKWLMLSMSRNMYFDVTQYVTYSNTPGFNGSLFNQPQLLNVGMNLSQIGIDGLQVNQIVRLNLFNPQSNPSTMYHISTNVNVSNTPYGNNIRAKMLQNNGALLDITCQNYELQSWLEDVYYSNVPMYNPQIESSAPAPTHFEIIYNNSAMNTNQLITNSQSQMFQIEQWNSPLLLTNANLSVYDTIIIRFLMVQGYTKAVLSVSPMMITQY